MPRVPADAPPREAVCVACSEVFALPRKRGRPHTLCGACRESAASPRRGTCSACGCGFSPGERGPIPKLCAACSATPVITSTCVVCGQVSEGVRAKRFCSPRCAGRFRALSTPRVSERRKAAARKLARAERGKSGRWTYKSGRCAGCGNWFTTTRSWQAFCSAACRGEREHIPSAVRIAVYLRDEWRCQLCGSTVKRKASAPDPEAPTLDHIVPVSRGGTDDPGNLQLAHFLCNVKRGNKMLAEVC